MKKVSLLLVALAFAMFSCKPEAEKPTVTTKSVGEITETTAQVVAQVTSDGGAEVTERGVCWSTESTPEITHNRIVEGAGVGEFTSNLSDLEPQTTYYVRAYATNEAGTSYGEELCFTTEVSCVVDGHEWVDLGLSVKWATCNVGANAPEEFGNYYAWGETEPKESYAPNSSPTYGLSYDELQEQGFIDENGTLAAAYDPATVNWSASWRTPTEEEMRELIDNCTWEWVTVNEVEGFKVIGTNGNSIFFPSAGYYRGTTFMGSGKDGNYWTSTLYSGSGNYSANLYFLNYSGIDDHGISWNIWYCGEPVRPVLCF